MSWPLPCATTDTILYESFEPNEEQYPGLPMLGEKPFIYTAITDGIPSMDLLRRTAIEHGADHRTMVVTLNEVRAMRDGLPSVYHRLAERFDQLQLPPTTDNRARMLQAQSEMLARVSTVSAALIHSRRDLETTISKKRQHCRIGRLLSGLGIRAEVDAAAAGPYTVERMDEILLGVKLGMVDMYERVAWPLVPAKEVLLTSELTNAEKRKYGFIPYYQDLLGDNLVACFAYGSSVRTDDEEKFDDLDTSMLVRDLSAAYAVLRGTKPHYDARTRRVGDTGKHIGINLFPAGGRMFHEYARSLDDVSEFRDNLKVLLHTVPFVETWESDELEHGQSLADIKHKTLIDSTGRYTVEPELLIGKQNLFEFFVKNIRFIFKHAMKLETGETLPKETLERILRDRHGIRVPKYKEDPEHLRDALLYARICSAFLHETYLRDRRFCWSYYTDDHPTDLYLARTTLPNI